MADKKSPNYFNRELSWLEFNQRVLEEAKDPGNPLLERLKFLAITASNLDEFYMVRVGGLHMARKAGRRKRDPSGLTPLGQLQEISLRGRQMMQELHGCFHDVVSPALCSAGICRVPVDALTSEQEGVVYDLFREALFPVITPMALVEDHPCPLLHNLTLHLLVSLQNKGRKKEPRRFAVMPLRHAGARIVPVPAASGFQYVLREDVLKKYAAHWFPGYEVVECALFRVTRNADFAVQEDEAPDLLAGMEEVLEERKTGDCIRLEVESAISKELLAFLSDQLGARAENIYPIDGVLNLKDFMSLAFMDGFDDLKAEAWPPQPSPAVNPKEGMFEQVARQDLLLYHPYESFDPVVRFVEEAAIDPETLAIKMVLYRTSSDSPIIAALQRAAENGINVTVLIELKARFDEARNIEWARELEQSGVQVVYGVQGYKTHAKICLVVRRDPAGIRRYCHFGTGNYNETTAKLYGDISYLTCNAGLGADASTFFNALCGYAQPQQFKMISMAPINMRERLLELIEVEIERARNGKKARIMAKVNSLVDAALIDKLYEASMAGVKIQLNVRGICCLKPGVKGLSENITVISIVDRYLEHARIIYFYHGGKPKVFIASADWMPRNLDKRLELLVPVEDPACRSRLIDILATHLKDNQRSWQLAEDGSYTHVTAKDNPPLRSQQVFYEQACSAIAETYKLRRTRFEPHRGSG